MNIQTPTPEIKEKNIKKLKAIWWMCLLIYGSLMAYDLWDDMVNSNNYYVDNPRNLVEYSFFNATGSYVHILSYLGIFAVSIFIYLSKKNNRMTILTSMMFISALGNDLSSFWFSLYKYGLNHYFFTTQVRPYFYYVEDLFFFLSASITYYAIMNFPAGKWIYKYAWTVLVLWAVLFALSIVLSFDIDIIYYGCLVFISGMHFVKYLTMNVSTQRQQIKWILVFYITLELINLALVTLDQWIILIFPNITTRIYYFAWGSLDAISEIVYLGIAIAFVVSIFRYRLWDAEIFINRAVVYSILTGLLGIIGAVSLAAINFFIQTWLGENSSVWAVIISVLPITAVFNPLRDNVQKVVDRYFKPEDVNFENHFLEFRSDIRDVLGTSHIIEIVSDQVKKQLGVDFAHIYLADKNDKILSWVGSNDTLKVLFNGELVVGEDNADYSLIVPLVVARPVFPDFIGVIVLGRRLNGRGYSTPMLNNLKILGANTGEAIYLSQLSERAKISTVVS